MFHNTTLKTCKVLILLVLTFIFTGVVGATDGFDPYYRSCNKDGYFFNTLCPCPPEDMIGVSVICGEVSSARMLKDKNGIWSTRTPVNVATVSVYENHPMIPTGKPFGRLIKKFSECITTETTGRYTCYMRQIVPGMRNYVVFSCGGRIADVKMVLSANDILELDSDVDCAGTYAYGSMDNDLDYVSRNLLLSCNTDGYVINANFAGINDERRQYIYQAADIGEDEADIRFAPFDNGEVVLGGLGLISHQGAFWEKDCVWQYRARGLERPFIKEDPFVDVRQKCALGVNHFAIGGSDLEYVEWKTSPVRYDIPDKNEEPFHRVWEDREVMNAAFSDPRRFAQYTHSTVGDCIGQVFIRHYGEDKDDSLIDCSEYEKCFRTIGDPLRNVHTAYSYASRMMSMVDTAILRVNNEKEMDEYICTDEELGDIRYSQIKPFDTTDFCEPGEPGCQWLLPTEFLQVADLLLGGPMPISYQSHTMNDRYEGPNRVEVWKPFETEAEEPHHSVDILYNSAGDGYYDNNDMKRMVRIANPLVTNDTAGVLANRYMSPIEAITSEYLNEENRVVWDLGSDIRGICNISGVQPGDTVIDRTNEPEIHILNRVTGDAETHRGDEQATTATYANYIGSERDEAFILADDFSELQGLGRDVVDTVLRYTSGQHYQEFFGELAYEDYLAIIAGIFNTIANHVLPGGEDGIYKSFGERTSDWNQDAPSSINVDFCISEEDFPPKFPAYGGQSNLFWDTSPEARGIEGEGVWATNNTEGFYPSIWANEEGASCYPWNVLPAPFYRSVDIGTYCNVHPGPGMVDFADNNLPDIDGSFNGLRTCRVVDCAAMIVRRSCYDGEVDSDGDGIFDELSGDYTECVDPNKQYLNGPWTDEQIAIGDGFSTTTNDDCGHPEGLNPIEYERAREDANFCLERQLDNWHIWEDKNFDHAKIYNCGVSGIAYSPICTGDGWNPEDPADWPGIPDYISADSDWDNTAARYVLCNLERAGPMIERASVEKDFSQRVYQEVDSLDSDSQLEMRDPMKISNAFYQGWRSPVDRLYTHKKGMELDSKVTNNYPNNTQGEGIGAVQLMTSGAMSEAAGTGAVKEGIKVVSHPERFAGTFERYPEIQYLCEEEWCALIKPPLVPFVDLDNLDVRSCKPVTEQASCSLDADNLPDIANTILGAAGAKYGVHGAILWAVMAGEGSWVGAAATGGTNLLEWTDENVRKWSDPWTGRFPETLCNEMSFAAQGPFGMITTWFNRAVWGVSEMEIAGEWTKWLSGQPIQDARVGGGYYSGRENEDRGIIVSKCNFLDAAYAAARMLSNYITPDCGSINMTEVARAIAVYRTGTNASELDPIYNPAGAPQELLDIVAGCR